jgi:lipid A 3-O-deacylase
MKLSGVGLLLLGAMAAAGQARAEGPVDSVHFGVMAHNIRVIDPKNANKEDGPAVELQINFDSPGFLRWAGAPTPYIVGSLNVAGDTSFGGVGLEWSLPLGEDWSVEPGLGYVIHDGALEVPFPWGSQEAVDFSAENVLLGSRDLFRTSIGLSRNFGGGWTGQVFFSHLSHGQILGDGRNQGMDQLGLRLGRRFGR